MCRKLIYLVSFVVAFVVAVPLCSAAIAPIDSVITDNPSGSPPYNLLGITVGDYEVTIDNLATGTTTHKDENSVETLCPENDDSDLNTALNWRLGDGIYATVNFGGGLWKDTNGDAQDFFLFESGGNSGDDPEIQVIFPDGSLGQMVKLPGIWGPTGLIRDQAAANDTVEMDGQELHGQCWDITDMLDAEGNPLTRDAVILGIQFARSGTDPVGFFAVVGDTPEPEPVRQQDAAGLVVIEAENFDNQEFKDQSNWFLISDSMASRGQAMASEDSGINYNQDDYPDVAPRLDYNCTFVKTGTHYVWLRMSYSGGDSDTAHLGINGAGNPETRRIDAPGSAEDAWQWSNFKQNPDGTAMIDIPSEGEHIVNLWVREDGIRIDKIILATDPNYVPEGYGPRDPILDPAITMQPSEDLVATGDYGLILSIDGVDVNDMVLGTTTFAGEPKWEDQLPEYADNFDLNSDASADDQAYVQTMFDLPVTTVYLVERGSGHPGMMVPLDTMGVPMDDPTPFTPDSFGVLPYQAYGNQGSKLMIITPETQIGGIRILPPEGGNLGIDPASISGVPAPVSTVAPISSLEVDDPNDDDPATPIVATVIDGISTSDLILGVTTANPDNQERADNFNVDMDSDYARRQPDTDFVITMFDVQVTTVYVLEKDGNDGGYIQPLDGDGLPIGGRVPFTANDFLKTETSGWTVGGMAVLPEVPIKGIRIWSTGIDVLSISAIPAPIIDAAPVDSMTFATDPNGNAILESINGINTSDLILGTTVGQNGEASDDFILERPYSGDIDGLITTTFAQPVTTIFVVEKDGNDSGYFRSLDVDGMPVGGRLNFSSADFSPEIADVNGNNDNISATVITSAVPIYGLEIWSGGIDPYSISAIPAQ